MQRGSVVTFYRHRLPIIGVCAVSAEGDGGILSCYYVFVFPGLISNDDRMITRCENIFLSVFSSVKSDEFIDGRTETRTCNTSMATSLM